MNDVLLRNLMFNIQYFKWEINFQIKNYYEKINGISKKDVKEKLSQIFINKNYNLIYFNLKIKNK